MPRQDRRRYALAALAALLAVLACGTGAEAQNRSRNGYCSASEWTRYAFRVPSPQHIELTFHTNPAGGVDFNAALLAVYDEEEENEDLQRQFLWWTTDQLSHMRIGLRGSRYTLWFRCDPYSWFQIGLGRDIGKAVRELPSRRRLEALHGVPTGSDYVRYLRREEELNRWLASRREANTP